MFLSKHFNRLLGVVFLCLIFFESADAQLKKGDYHVDFRSTLSYSSLTKKPSFGLDITYLKMTGNRFMVGGGLLFQRSHANGGFGISSFTNFQVRQISRYYVATGRVAPFISLEHLFFVSKIGGASESFLGYQLSPGLGLTYFLRPNIALEGLLKSNVLNMGDFDSDQQFINFNLGLKLFFNDKFFAKAKALPERILKKGNIISSTRLNFLKEIGGAKNGLLTSAPNIRYFLSDRLNITAGYLRTRARTPVTGGDDRINNRVNLSLGAAYYIGLSDKLFWNFDFINTITMNGDKLSEMFDNGIRVITTNVSTSLQHFTGPAKFYGGVGYYTASLNGFGIDSDEFVKVASDYELFFGVDYYISDYIYLNSDLRYTNFGSLNFRGTGNSLRLGFGIGFIIGKGGVVEEAEEM